jgi:hypothetical protein
VTGKFHNSLHEYIAYNLVLQCIGNREMAESVERHCTGKSRETWVTASKKNLHFLEMEVYSKALGSISTADLVRSGPNHQWDAGCPENSGLCAIGETNALPTQAVESV